MNLTKCSYCGGALKTVGVANNRSKYQCHHCKAIIDIEEDRAEKWFAFEEYINAIVACYSEVGNDRDVAERFHNNTEIKEKWGNVKKYAHDVLSTPYLAVLHALYLTEGFTRFSRRAESLIAVARERDHQSDHFKTCIRDYDKKRAEQVKKQKTRTTLIIVMVFLVVLVAVLGAVAYQPTFYDESTGISVEISQKLMGFVDKFRMTLTVEEHPESSPAYIDAKHALRRETEKFHLYDIVLKNGSEPFLFDGSVTVSIPIPEGYEVGNL
ncbi:MAG: hypothetical protein IJW46_01280, partial [Clostridia bacterium]|nr:hypothetical protein [Clostridia bacterium]